MNTKVKLNVDQLAMTMQAEHHLMMQIGTVCFRRCCSTSFETEFLNPLEQNCVDRCGYKFTEMVSHIERENPAMQL